MSFYNPASYGNNYYRSVPTSTFNPIYQNHNGLSLINVDTMLIKQKKEYSRFIGVEKKNQYEIYDQNGRLILNAVEDKDTDFVALCCNGGKNRAFCIRVADSNGQQIFVVNSSLNSSTRQVTIENPPGQKIADIFQSCAFFKPTFYISDSVGRLMFKIKSPLLANCADTARFDIMLAGQEKRVIGKISKEWGGVFKEMFTTSDTFGISLPAQMDSAWKAVLLGLTFVIDFQFYEKR